MSSSIEVFYRTFSIKAAREESFTTLFTRGPISQLEAWEWAGVVASFLMIYLVPGFHTRLAAEVMAELMREERAGGDSGAE